LGYVERQNLAGRYAGIKSVEGGAGRPAIAPEMFFAQWLFATLEGGGSARGIARLTKEHDAYRWICGGVQVNYRTVADFRSLNGEFLDDLLTDNLASLKLLESSNFRRSPTTGCEFGRAPALDRFDGKRSSRVFWMQHSSRSKHSRSGSTTIRLPNRGDATQLRIPRQTGL
jgi:hypothetical protein